MRICFVVPSFYPATRFGGPIYSTLGLCKALASRGNSVEVLTTDASKGAALDVRGPQPHTLAENLSVWYCRNIVPDRFSAEFCRRLVPHVRRADVVAVSGFFNIEAVLGLIAGSVLGRPLVVSPRGVLAPVYLRTGRLRKRIWARMLVSPFASSALWHATSVGEACDIRSLLGRRRVCVIPNGVDARSYRKGDAVTREQFCREFAPGLRACPHVIVTMARLHKVKNIDKLIQAHSVVRRRLPDAHLFIAGEDAGMRKALQRLVTRLRITENVHFMGHISGDRKVRFLGGADVFALPSAGENFGMVYAEALAAGTPVVASRNTPWRIVERRGCGRWVSVAVDDIADGIMEVLLQDARSMGIRGQKLISERFDWPVVAQRYERLLWRAVERANKRVA